MRFSFYFHSKSQWTYDVNHKRWYELLLWIQNSFTLHVLTWITFVNTYLFHCAGPDMNSFCEYRPLLLWLSWYELHLWKQTSWVEIVPKHSKFLTYLNYKQVEETNIEYGIFYQTLYNCWFFTVVLLAAFFLSSTSDCLFSITELLCDLSLCTN